jgi:hypothetical protein
VTRPPALSPGAHRHGPARPPAIRLDRGPGPPAGPPALVPPACRGAGRAHRPTGRWLRRSESDPPAALERIHPGAPIPAPGPALRHGCARLPLRGGLRSLLLVHWRRGLGPQAPAGAPATGGPGDRAQAGPGGAAHASRGGGSMLAGTCAMSTGKAPTRGERGRRPHAARAVQVGSHPSGPWQVAPARPARRRGTAGGLLRVLPGPAGRRPLPAAPAPPAIAVGRPAQGQPEAHGHGFCPRSRQNGPADALCALRIARFPAQLAFRRGSSLRACNTRS